jgi:hypothetical protein
VSINFSIPGNVALLLLKKRLTGEELLEENLKKDAEKIKQIGGRVKLVHNLEMTVEMVRKMNPSLKIEELFRNLSIIQLIRARNRITRQYGRRMGLSFESVFNYLRDKRGVLITQAGREFRARLGKWIAGETGAIKRWSLSDADLENFTMPFSSKVSVKLRDGKILEHKQDIPRGGPGEPVEERKKLVLNKFITESANVLSEKYSKTIADKILMLDKLSSVKELVEEICGK